MTEFTVVDPLFGAPDLKPTVWNVSFVNLARDLVDAIRAGHRTMDDAATFLDGWRNQIVLDAARQFWDEKRWIEIA